MLRMPSSVNVVDCAVVWVSGSKVCVLVEEIDEIRDTADFALQSTEKEDFVSQMVRSFLAPTRRSLGY